MDLHFWQVRGTVQITSVRECPRHHEREFFSPERVTMRPVPLIHDDIRTSGAKRIRPSGGVLAEERFLPASDEVGAGQRARHFWRRLVAAAR